MFVFRILLLSAILWLQSCSSTPSEGLPDPPKVIVGGTLIDGTGRPPIPDAIVIVELGKIVVATSANGIKIPDKAIKTNAKGLYITPSQTGARLEYGASADLFLLSGNPLDNPLILGNPMRVMKTGEWLDANKK
jgi:imidazolonepropionase-like amidohydrolase